MSGVPRIVGGIRFHYDSVEKHWYPEDGNDFVIDKDRDNIWSVIDVATGRWVGKPHYYLEAAARELIKVRGSK